MKIDTTKVLKSLKGEEMKMLSREEVKMKVELSKSDCQNIVLALIALSKSPEANINAMKELINLSDKFIWKEPVKEEVKKKKGVA